MKTFKQLFEKLSNPTELTGKRRKSRLKRETDLTMNLLTSSGESREKTIRILKRMLGRTDTERELSHPAADRELKRRSREEI